MGKSKGGGRRRKNSKHYESNSDDEDYDYDGNHDSNHDGNGNRNGNRNVNRNRDAEENDNNKGKADLSFADRRELQRKAAAEKRRQKMKCYICGKTGHVRKECPGIADDGRGESKYTKSNAKKNGDAGSVHLKQKNNNKKNKGGTNTNTNTTTRRDNSNSNSGGMAETSLALPPGFEKRNEEQANHAHVHAHTHAHTHTHARNNTNTNSSSSSNTNNNNNDEDDGENASPPFLYFDAGVDEGNAVLEYMRFGRHGHGGGTSKSSNTHHNLSRHDAISEYDTAMRHVCESTNFGGCIVRSYLPPMQLQLQFEGTNTTTNTTTSTNTQPWTPSNAFPFSWFQSTPSLLKFVVGYRCDDDDDDGGDNDGDNDYDDLIVDRLVETATNHKGLIVGFFADLDYTSLEEKEEEESGLDLDNSLRGRQLQRLKNTLSAASRVGCPVQIRIVDKPCHHSAGEGSHQGVTTSTSTSKSTPAVDGYSKAIRDLGTILLETPAPWNVHLSSWNGKAEHLVALAGAFSSSKESSSSSPHEQQRNLYFGFDGSVGFSKASHLHESAFEVPLHQIILESGGPGILPPVVARCCGKNAFCHSGHIPFIAQELARHAGRNPRNTLHTTTTTTANDRVTGTGTNVEQLPREITAQWVARLASATTKALYGLP